MRLNRFLSAAGFASRRKGETVIRAGRVLVNGEIITDPARDVDAERDCVSVDGVRLSAGTEHRYYLLNKPAGVIVSAADTHGRPTVLDLLGGETGRVFPVGRLDADTSGVLLLTDDGDLAFRLTHPSFGVEKEYRALVKGRVTARDVRRVAEGLELDDGPASPALMRILEGGGKNSVVELVLHEGRKRQVRRMMDVLGHPVVTLERTVFGGITAGNLSPGLYRPLTPAEVARLREETAVGREHDHTPLTERGIFIHDGRDDHDG